MFLRPFAVNMRHMYRINHGDNRCVVQFGGFAVVVHSQTHINRFSLHAGLFKCFGRGSVCWVCLCIGQPLGMIQRLRVRLVIRQICTWSFLTRQHSAANCARTSVLPPPRSFSGSCRTFDFTMCAVQKSVTSSPWQTLRKPRMDGQPLSRDLSARRSTATPAMAHGILCGCRGCRQ